MFSNLTYKKRLWLLIGSLPIIILICYNLAIKKTFELISNCSIIEENLKNAEDAPRRIYLLENQLNDLNNKIGGGNNNIDNPQQELLSKISEYTKDNNVIIGKLPSVHVVTKDDYTIKTIKVVVEGKFKEIIKLLYNIENNYLLGKIVSVDFYSKKNLRTEQVQLFAVFYSQTISSNKVEN